MVNPRLPAHFNHISQPIEKYKLLSMHFWVARRHAAELPVEPVTFRVRSFLFRINWVPRCGSDVLRVLLFNCSARSQYTSCAWRVSPGDETSRAVQRLAMLMQHKQTRYALEVYFEFYRLLREMGSAAVAQSHPFFLK